MKSNKNIYRKMSVWAIGALLAGSAYTSQAAVLATRILINDNFENDVTNLDDTELASTDVTWFPSNGGPTNPLLGLEDESGNNVQTVDILDETTFRTTRANYTSTTLNTIGESLTLSFRVRAEDTDNNGDGNFAFSLTEAGSGGYVFLGSWGPGSSDGIWTGVGALGTAGGQLIDGVGNFDLTGTGWHTINATIELASATDLTFTYGLAGTDHINAVTVTPATLYTTFDRIDIGSRNPGQDFRLDDVLLTADIAVPEPSSLAFLIAGAAILFMARRKRPTI